MDAYQVPFGVLLCRWRDQRRMTQTDLAYAAESSTRHLSCLETGKAQPSREMIARLAEYLEIPLRDQNSLFLAAGMAPRIVNYGAWRAHLLSVLRQQIDARGDAVLQGLLAEVSAYPTPPDCEPAESFGAAERLATPLRIATRLGIM